ncbi:CAP domain-containing protein [Caulobacter segnis]|uniref:CAP domain-containing protein n=1 Tax=Caulobacter segnis TaxID=88688 RepID=UPI001CBAF1C4|nr:CAP domain-containing protein [Caulobacter segnis]UAL11870.1 CAP domain-containing protein [Caulobacter segnis]
MLCRPLAHSWALLSAAFLIPAIAHADDLEDAVLAEVNYVRAHPAEYARELRRAPDWAFEQEEPGAVEEAIDFLERQPPLAPLKSDRRLDVAARQHAQRQAARGDVGHGPAGSLGVRLRAAGVFAGLSAENISYGSDDARAIVRQLVIDSRVAGRGHRRNIFTASYSAAGVACGGHRQWGSMCVIDFAGALMERGKAE